MYIPEGAECVGLRASEVEMSPSWDIKHIILTFIKKLHITIKYEHKWKEELTKVMIHKCR